MYRVAFALAASSAFVIWSNHSASAADIPARAASKAPVMVAPVAHWTGWYVGLNAGYGWGDEAVRLIGDTVAVSGITSGVLPGSLAARPGGFVGGGQIGYNHQINQWLFGVEADLQWANIKDSQTIFLAPGGGLPPFSTTAAQKLDWFGTVRGRVGFMPSAPWLLYATGGLAYGHVTLSANSALSHPTLPPCFMTFCGAGSASFTQAGWAAGGGVEYAFNRAWSIRAEYLYYNLGNVLLVLPDLLNRLPPLFQQYTVGVNGNIVRAGVNYQFGG